MNSVKALRSILLATSLGGLTAAGCVINVGPLDCSTCDSEPLCHNHFGTNADGAQECFCDSGYTWENPNDPEDFECDRVPPRPGDSNCNNDFNEQVGNDCFCASGYTWCTDDPNDLSCCVDDSQDSVGGTGVATEDPSESETGTGTGTGVATEPGTGTAGDTDGTETGIADSSSGGQAELPPCDATLDMQFFCTNTDAANPEGSSAYFCENGEWTEIDPNEQCTFDGFDFSYGCAQIDDSTQFLCGDGPGTDCTSGDDACVDASNLNICVVGKLTARDCVSFCQTEGEGGMTFDTGYCDDTVTNCVCCDAGDAGCPE